jgi:hypothetical protein
MNPRIVIDALVRQTTILIARISTLEGTRSPLAHVANEVFAGLNRELEHQGVGKKVIADMFGLALRSYRQKVQRLGESATAGGVTLWSAIHSFLAGRGGATRSEVLARFRADDEASVRGILNDLAESGLVLRSGRGEDTVYRVATADELEDLGQSSGGDPAKARAAIVWLNTYREGPLSKARIAELVPLAPNELDAAIFDLLQDGRIRLEARADGEYFVTDECLIPVGEAAGWEAAVIDHHRAVLNALGAKLTSGTRSSARSDEVGGTTLSFDLWPGHPQEQEVRQLLATTRASVIPLWERVTKYNLSHRPEGAYQVHYYCGQYVIAETDDA